MIAAAVSAIAGQLDLSLRRTFRVAEDLVVVSPLTEPDGSPGQQVSNRLALFLVNVEKDPLPWRPATAAGAGPGRVALAQAPVHLNLLLMLAASFGGTHYPEALKFLSHAIAFFQSRPVLDHQNTPELDPRIDRLVLDIENLAIPDLGNLWGILGGRYAPSVLYRVRLVTIDAGQLAGQVPRVSTPGADVSA